ncbi:MAG: hypothetical protein Q9202_004345 [Teloschistes flavicans]
MYFPFLTCEVKCGAEALDIADRQNAHSMTVAVRGVIELFRVVNRQAELHREILAFSISHNDSNVRIYGHYTVIQGDQTTFYRHLIRRFDFTDPEGKEKWSTYDFTKNVYEIWKPTHHKRICSALDDLPPDVDVGLLESAPSQSASFSLSSTQDSQHSKADEGGYQSSPLGTQANTPTTSFTQPTEPAAKKVKKGARRVSNSKVVKT